MKEDKPDSDSSSDEPVQSGKDDVKDDVIRIGTEDVIRTGTENGHEGEGDIVEIGTEDVTKGRPTKGTQETKSHGRRDGNGG